MPEESAGKGQTDIAGSSPPPPEVAAHLPVLCEAVLTQLRPRPGGRYIDGTLGFGGHTRALLEATAPDGRVLAFDRDQQAIAAARERLGLLAERVTFVHGSYGQMGTIAPAHGFAQVDGIVLDLGLSSLQLDDAARGFAFRLDGPLDMRFDQSQGETAAELLDRAGEAELAEWFWRYGEEPRSRQLAAMIVRNRPILTTRRLADLVARHSPRPRRDKRQIHPATRLFQALRIVVNGELDELERGLPATLSLLRPGGRLAVISFHSLEDRAVKHFLREQAQSCLCPPRQILCTCGHTARVTLPQRRAIQPDAAEIAANPRSRSARLRIAERL
jgi:16S rRNA (cytosine1402-N4)-methyltransferase